jgi:hypothetical protein
MKKQRLGVAQALLCRPRLLILDKPINELDAVGMRIVRETLTGFNKQEGAWPAGSRHGKGYPPAIAKSLGAKAATPSLKRICKYAALQCQRMVAPKWCRANPSKTSVFGSGLCGLSHYFLLPLAPATGIIFI